MLATVPEGKPLFDRTTFCEAITKSKPT